jgi:hypothetical protein
MDLSVKLDNPNILREHVLHNDELKVLKDIAYQWFVVVSGQKTIASWVKDLAVKYPIIGEQKILKVISDFGLLKGRTQEFIHLSFQEYLTAAYLKEELLGKDGSWAAEFIAIHRNEPRYLMTLKLLAGLVTHDAGENAEIAVTRFWSAVTCNVDGVLEFGTQTKVKLLMHLLGQASVIVEGTKSLDPRIPNLQIMKDLIDEEVLQHIGKDFGRWSKIVIASNYLSPKVAAAVIKVVTGEIASEGAEELKQAAEVMVSFAHRIEFGSKVAVFSHLMQLLSSDNWQVQKFALQKLNYIFSIITDKKLLSHELHTCADLLLATEKPLIADKNFRAEAQELLASIIKANANIEHVINLVISLSNNDDSFMAAALAVSVMVKVNPGLVNQVPKLLSPLFSHYNKNIRDTAADAVLAIVKRQPELADQMLELLLPSLNDGNPYAKSVVASLMSGLVEARPELAGQILEGLRPFLNRDNWQIIDFVVEPVPYLVVARPELISKALACLHPLFKFGLFTMQILSANAILEIVKKKPDVADQVLEWLHPFLNDENDNVKFMAAKTISGIVEARPVLADQVLQLLYPLLKDENIDLKNQAVSVMSSIAAARSDLAGQVLDLLRPLFNDEDNSVKDQAVSAMSGVVTARSDLADQVLELVRYLFNDKDNTAKDKAVAIMSGIVAVRSDLADQVLELIRPLLNDEHYYDKYEALGTMSSIVAARADLADKVLELIFPLFNDEGNNLKKQAVSAMSGLVTARPGLADKVLGLILPLFNDNDSDVKKLAAKSISDIILVKSELASKILELLRPLFDDTEGYNVQEAVAETVSSIAKVQPELAEQILALLRPLLNSGSISVKSASVKSISDIVVSRPELASQVLEWLRPLFHDYDSAMNSLEQVGDSDRKKVIAESISVIVKTLSISQIVSLNLMNDSVHELREVAFEVLPSKLAAIDRLEDFGLFKILLQVIGHESKDADESVKTATTAARTAIYRFVDAIDATTWDSAISWINECFDELLVLSSEAYSFFKAIYNKALIDGEISEADSEFIINCIKHGFTSTFTRKGEIIFEDKTYQLDVSSVAELAKGAMTEYVSQENDVLAAQYKGRTPQFVNAHAFKVAAIDIKEVNSLTGQGMLKEDSALLSILRDVKTSEKFALIEKRSVFGDIMISKLDSNGTISTLTLHPNGAQKTQEGNAELHGLLTVLPYSVYEARQIELSAESLNNMLLSLDNTSSSETKIELLTRILSGTLSTSPSVVHGWNLLAIEPDADMLQLAKQIQETETLKGRVEDHEVRITRTEQELKVLAAKLQITDQQMKQMNEKLKSVANQESVDKVLTLLDDMATLQEVIKSKKVEVAARQELDDILSDPYKASFYNVLRSELNSTYLASMVVQTDIVSNSRTEVIGNLGSLLQTASVHVPIVGVGVLFFGTVLGKVDQITQSKIVGRYASIASSSGEMEQLTEKIARSIINSLDQTKLNKHSNIMNTCKGLIISGITTATNVSSGSSLLEQFATLAFQVAPDEPLSVPQSFSFMDCFCRSGKKTLTAAEEEAAIKAKQISQGKLDAGIVASLIISLIYSGQITDETLEARTNHLIKFVQDEFGGIIDYKMESKMHDASNSIIRTTEPLIHHPSETDEVLKTDLSGDLDQFHF